MQTKSFIFDLNINANGQFTDAIMHASGRGALAALDNLNLREGVTVLRVVSVNGRTLSKKMLAGIKK